MTDKRISISDYTNSDRSELLRLLLELHSTYFHENASQQLQELNHDLDIRKSFEKYLDLIEQNENDTWRIYLAKTDADVLAGIIIGSIETDDYLALNKIGKFEDWYVEQTFRGQGIGLSLYYKLEKWFKEKGCHQVKSDTWDGNQLSIKAHEQAGFFISGIKFRKKI